MKPGKGLDKKQLVDPELLDILVCPITRSRLVLDTEAEELISERAGLAYPVRDGIPVLLVEEARKL
ncbi:Trm112 family protein [Parasphingorhabdus sp.]|uniref:Trm112 family protein n=1 Tax=Parasphingorhabdus sp. TaxID=2709688 RepID=UPI003A914FA6